MCEMPEVYICDHPKARKEHTCCECRGKIAIGEKYHKHHGIWDGEAATYKACDDCEALRADVDAEQTYADEKSAITGLHESVFESDDPAWIKRFVAIKRKRGATIPPWMAEREAECEEAKTV